MAYMDTSLVLSEKLYEVNEIEGAFFLAATHGFVARLESDRGNWGRAAISGKNALSYVDVVRENVDFSPEVLFGDAIMNYYTEWIRDNYPLPVRTDPVPLWQKRAAAVLCEKNPHKALKKDK